MTPDTPPARALRPTARRSPWPIVCLLVVSVAINYTDRANLSIAAPLLKLQLALSPSQLGLLLSAFFWSYSVMQLASGWLVDRFNVNLVLITGFVLWSGATAVTAWAGGFAVLLGLRLLLGFGESVAYPSYGKIFVEHLNERQRGVANSLIDAGSKFGPAFGTLVGGMLVAHFGWRLLFLVTGFCGFLWLPGWLKCMPRGAPNSHRLAAGAPSFREILRHRSLLASSVGHFSGNYYWYFLLTWLPSYLVEARHFSLSAMAVVGALPPLFSAGATIVAGWCSYRALGAGATPTRVRKTCTVTGLTFATVIILVPLAPGVRTSMGLLFFASISYGVFASSHWVIAQTIAGPLAVGRWSGVQNFISNLAGVVAPALTGFVVQWTGNFRWAFFATGVVTLTGAAAYLFALGPVEPARWKPAPSPA